DLCEERSCDRDPGPRRSEGVARPAGPPCRATETRRWPRGPDAASSPANAITRRSCRKTPGVDAILRCEHDRHVVDVEVGTFDSSVGCTSPRLLLEVHRSLRELATSRGTRGRHGEGPSHE